MGKAASLKIELDGARVVTLLQPAQVRQLSNNMMMNVQDYPPEQVKTLLRGVLNRITLTRSSTGAISACLDYEIPIESRDMLASPREVKHHVFKSLLAGRNKSRQISATPRLPMTAIDCGFNWSTQRIDEIVQLVFDS